MQKFGIPIAGIAVITIVTMLITNQGCVQADSSGGTSQKEAPRQRASETQFYDSIVYVFKKDTLNKAALLLGLTDAQMSVFLRMAVPQIADMLLTPLKIDTEILDLKDAKDFHSYYNSTRNPDQSLSVDTTRAVYFTLKEILSSLATLYRTDSIPDLNNAALYAYLLRYSKNGSSIGRGISTTKIKSRWRFNLQRIEERPTRSYTLEKYLTTATCVRPDVPLTRRSNEVV
jgi:hypothetical protein